ncbi:MAG TPA: imidazole glycerol phosphate synthase subunit HisH [Chitinophagaceae bacterium]|nr:imidazole glycerol phosphate synthase subunit HisH [Chitinophagaceae bacterium]
MSTVIIKYNAGNIQSVLFALERIGETAVVTDDVMQIQQAGKVIFPGVGEASSAMKYLQQRGLDRVIRELTQPVLGICLGMQLLCRHSEENDTGCLGIFDTQVKKFRDTLKVPQMGWNSISRLSGPLFSGVEEESYCYFVHSYYAELSPYTIATTEYGIPFSSALAKDNFYGVQFHTEKSAATGEQILKNFLSL